MKHSIGALLLAFAVLCSGSEEAAAAGGGKAAAKGQGNRIYQVMWQGENVGGRLTINGFTVSDFKGGPVTGTAAVNVWLTGRNEIRAELRKKDPKAPASFSLGASGLAMGDVVSTGDRGNLFHVMLADADLSGRTPKVVTKTFNTSLDFSSHLLASGPSRFGEREVLEYAVRLHGLFRKKDARAILQAMEVKAEDYARAYGRPVADFRESVASMLKEDFFKGRLAGIDAKKLRAEKVNGLWHIRDGDAELIRTRSSDGSTSELPIFVGDIEGKLMVVR
ncbi:MAG TPA: hypothetical protein PLO63_05785 [Syntrophales bacterium]|jgi:hypothetical protein|nr:hypothetical protein [Syntrophales bacterium]